MNCHFDFEIQNELDLSIVGLDRYITHPSAKILLCSYWLDNKELKTWEPHLSDIPEDFLEALENPEVTLWTWNSAFERNATKWLLGIDISINRFKDVMIQARYCSLPGGLGECGTVLHMPLEERKIDTNLVDFFCLPAKEGGKETLFGIEEPVFRTHATNPIEWQKFVEYNRQDVVAEKAILKRLSAFPVPQQEWELFWLSEQINERGVLIDSDLVAGGSYVASAVKKDLLEQIATITKLENPNSNPQILEWARKNGYPFHSLGKSFVSRALAGEGNLTEDCKKVLTIRSQSAKTSANKLEMISQQVGSDSRLRHQYNFFGASRTGRWSSGSGD